ncbi:MAG TPA: ABC transporter permease, partial [Microbacteriaceae bacterium]|nr:ABC transporter permease [Microbacteriaceae bacterium]
LLGLQGLLIFVVNLLAGQSSGGTMSVSNKVINDIAYGHVNDVVAWIALVVIIALYAIFTIVRDRHRRSRNLVAQPVGLAVVKIVFLAAAGAALVLACSAGSGVPWAVPIVLAIVFGWTFLLAQTRFGRYVYAIGGNAEAARRAGINLSRIRLIAFALASLTAGAAGIFYAARLGSISNNINGGQYVLLAVAAAVIGGTSLFGGRGKIVHALLGGLIVATIYNGMGLLNLSAATQLMVTALVLLAAVTVDALSRRNRATANASATM